MDIKELKLYTKNLDSYEAEEVDELQPMTDEELDQFQYEIEYATGNTSDWDRLRAVITLKKHIHEWETYAIQMRDTNVVLQGDYYRMHGKFLEKSKQANELELEINKLKATLEELNSLEPPRDFWKDAYHQSQAIVLKDGIRMEKLEAKVEELKAIEKCYGQLINEHAELVHFKDVATKYLTEEQLIAIEDEMENIPDTSY